MPGFYVKHSMTTDNVRIYKEKGGGNIRKVQVDIRHFQPQVKIETDAL